MIDITLPDKLVAPVAGLAWKNDITLPERANNLIAGLSEKVVALLPINDDADLNNFALAFVSMVFIIQRYELSSKLQPDQIDEVYANIYNKIENKKLETYLKLLSSDLLGPQTLTQAIGLEPDCAVAYYLKAVTLLSNLSSIKDIHAMGKQKRREIIKCLDNMYEIELLLMEELGTEGLANIYHDFSGNKEDLDFAAIFAILKYEQELTDKANINAIYEEVKKQVEVIDPADAETRVKHLFAPTVYEEVAKHKAVMEVLETGEAFWLANINETKAAINDNGETKALVPLIVPYLKAVELYLFEKITKLGAGKKLTVSKKNYNLTDQENGRDYLILKNASVGKYSQIIECNREILLRSSEEGVALIAKIRNWTAGVRNAKLHKKTKDSLQRVREIKKDTIELLACLVNNFKPTE